MELQIEVNGRVRSVSVEPAGDRFRVTVDGTSRLFDAARIDDSTFSLVDADDGQTSHEVGIAETGINGELAVHTGQGVATVRVLTGAGRAGARGAATVQATGLQQVLAPMPGKVVRVLVSPGDQVKARQGLVVVEAMKMENELRSPKDGRVREVAVTEGMSVVAGRLLVVVE
jgi:biotin carboxyl carrier protein